MHVPLMTIEGSAGLPEAADVVVIGGGAIGAFTALYLAERGLKVALVEKGRIGAEQSSRNWGWCRQQNRDARELPMATRSLALWDDLARLTGEDAGFKRCGLLYLSDDEAEIAGWAKWVDFARTVGVASTVLDGAEATRRGASTGKAWKGGIFSGTDGIADPARAAPIAARGVLKLGGSVHQMCAARGLETEAGRVSAVVTEKGTIKTRIVVMAGGAWASSFCRRHGIHFPQASVRSTILSLAPGAPHLPEALHTARVSVTRRGDGGHTLAVSGFGQLDPTPQQLRWGTHFLPMFVRRWKSLRPGGIQGWRSGHETLRSWRLDEVTPMERMRVLDPEPTRWIVEETRRRAAELLPDLAPLPIQAAWGGYIDSTPDGVPVIGEIASLPGFILAAGFSGHGFGIAPGAGELIADLITGTAAKVEAAQYRPERFAKSAWGKVADF